MIQVFFDHLRNVISLFFVVISFASLDFIINDNDDPKSRSNVVKSMKYRATSPDWKDIAMVIAPEGTTANGTNLCQFKPGVFIPGMPVQSFVIYLPEWWDYVRNGFRVTEKMVKERGYGWSVYTSDSGWPMLFDLLCGLLE